MNPPPPPVPRRGLPRFPLVVLALAGLIHLAIRLAPNLERNLAGLLGTLVHALTLVLLLGWFLLTSRFRARTRLATLAVLLLAALALKASLRIQGVADGTGRPRFVWRWTQDRNSAQLALVASTIDSNRTATPDPRLAAARDVPQFFGPRRDGRVTGAGLDPDWSARPPRELWRQPVGPGWSAFAVVGDLAYTQEQRGDEELVTARELLTGRLRWVHADRARFEQWQAGEGPHATPTVLEGRVYAYGATGLLNCLDAAQGTPIWQRSVLDEHRLSNLEWGVSASPLVEDRLVIVTGAGHGPALFAFLRDTGQPAWKAGNDQASYASPVAATLAGRRVILDANARALVAHDPVTGLVLLDHPWGHEKWPRAAQPVVLDGDRVFLAAGYGMGCQLLRIAATPEGRLSATVLWRGMSMKTQFNSVAVRDGHLYGLDDGLLACVDAATGKRRWKDGRFGSGQSLLVDDLVLVQAESGDVVLAGASPEGYREHGRIPALKGKTWNHPTLAGRLLLVRNDTEAACYVLPDVAGASR